jgi:hypothetical protein
VRLRSLTIRHRTRLPLEGMKKRISILILSVAMIVASAIKAGDDWRAEPLESPGELRGTIDWISKEGMLVDGAFKRRVMGNTIFGGPFFLTGYNKEAVDGQAIDALPCLMDSTLISSC